MRGQRLIASAALIPLLLLAAWLALPHLLGLAINQWLRLPGIDQLAVRFDRIGWRQQQIDSLRFRYRSEAGDTVLVSTRDLTLDIDLDRWHADQILIREAVLQVRPGEATKPSPWPKVSLPRLPFDVLRVERLVLYWQGSDAPWQDTVQFSLRQDDSRRLLAEMRTGDARLRTTASELSGAVQVGVTAELQNQSFLHLTGTLADDMRSRPAQLQADLDLARLREWLEVMRLPAQMPPVAGRLQITAAVAPGENSGEWRQSSGTVALDEVVVETPEGRAELHGSVAFAATPVAASGQWQPGSAGELYAGDPTLGHAQFSLTEPFTLHWQATGMAERSGVLRSEGRLPFRWDSPRWGSWKIEADGFSMDIGENAQPTVTVNLAVNGTLKELAYPPVQVRQLSVTGPLTTTIAEHLSVSVGKPLRVAARRVDLASAGQWTLHQPVLNWQGYLQLARRAESWQLDRIDARLSGRQIAIEQGERRLTFDDWRSRLQLGDRRWRGQWQAASASVALDGQQLSAAPLSLRVLRFDPATSDAHVRLTGERIRHGAMGDWSQPSLTAELRTAGTEVWFSGAAWKDRTELLQFTGSHHLTQEQGQVELSWRHDLADLNALLQPRPRALQPMQQLRGRGTGEFKLRWQRGPARLGLDAEGTLQLVDTALQWDQARAEQMRVSAWLNALSPLQGELELHIPQAELAAGLPVRDTSLSLRLGADRLQVGDFRSALLGGVWSAEAQSLPRAPSGHALNVAVTGLDLGRLLTLVDANGLSGSGTLDGVLPFVVEAEGIAVRNGELRSRQPGVLKYAPGTNISDNPGLQALQDFRYRDMQIALNYQPSGQYRIRLKLDGYNPALYNGYPIALNLDLNGALPGLFQAALWSGDFNKYVLQQLQSHQFR